MTDITELAQSLKAAITEATPGGWYVDYDFDVCTEGCGFIAETHGNNLVHNAQYIALANPANILALVEALEKAQIINAAAEKLVRCKGRYHSEQNYRALAALFGVTTPDLPPIEHENVHYADAAEMEIAALRQRIAELESRTVTVKLPAAPHDTPALNSLQSVDSVAGKWIPVSEQMPEKGQAVLVYRPKAHEGGDSDVRVAVYGRHNFEHGFGCYWEPSHWMPLPDGPQEVKGE